MAILFERVLRLLKDKKGGIPAGAMKGMGGMGKMGSAAKAAPKPAPKPQGAQQGQVQKAQQSPMEQGGGQGPPDADSAGLIEQHNAKIKQLEQQVAEIDKDIQAAEGALSGVEGELSGAQSQQPPNEQAITQLQQKKGQLNDYISSKKNQKAALENAVKVEKDAIAGLGQNKGMERKASILGFLGPEGMAAQQVISKGLGMKQQHAEKGTAKKEGAAEEKAEKAGSKAGSGSSGHIPATVGGAAAGGFTGSVIGSAMKAGGDAGDAIGKHVQENPLFLFVLFVAFLDGFNNMMRGTDWVQLNILLLIAIVILLLVSLAAPRKMFWAVLGIILTGLVLYITGYLSLNIPVGPATMVFLLAYIIIFVWAWLIFKKEEPIYSKSNLKIGLFYVILSACAYYIFPLVILPKITEVWIQGVFIFLARPWLAYLLIGKRETKLVGGLGAVYIGTIIIILVVGSGLPAVIMKQAAAAEAGGGGANVDSKQGFSALLDKVKNDFQKTYSQTQKGIKGENIEGEVNEETRKLFIGVEFQDPLLGNKKKFDPDTDKTLEITARIHSYGYKSSVPVTMSCFGSSTDVIQKTNEFIDPGRFSLATIRPESFSENVFIPEDVKCIYNPASSKNQVIALLARADNFRTDAYVENNFIDKESLRNRLERYALDTRRGLDTSAAVRSAVASIPEYEGVPQKVMSFSDNGPATLLLATDDFPVIGIDDEATITLKVAVENKVTSVGSPKQTHGRIEKVNSISVIIPAGLAPASVGCEAWSQQGKTITLSGGALAEFNAKVKKIKKDEQERFPDCALVMTDRETLLLKPDRPNPAAFTGSVDYDYAVQRTFSVKTTQKKTSSSGSASTSSVKTTNTKTSEAKTPGEMKEGWTAETLSKAKTDCVSEEKDGLGEVRVSTACDCWVQEISKRWTYGEYDANYGSIETQLVSEGKWEECKSEGDMGVTA